MGHRATGSVSRKGLQRALEAVGAPFSHHGGEIVIALPGVHLRVGGRRGVSPLVVQRLLRRMELSGFPVEAFRTELYGRAKGQSSCVREERAA